MVELSLHILDIVQNSIQANANEIEIKVLESTLDNLYRIVIKDNGKGMDVETLKKLDDPFFTTKNKKTGLGLPLLKQQCEACNGTLTINSLLALGTEIEATFELNHWDRQPMGNIRDTLIGFFRSFEDISFKYVHKTDEGSFEIGNKEILETLDGLSIQNKEVIDFLKHMIDENLKAIEAEE